MPTTTKTVPVTRRAVMQRVNRKLGQRNEALRAWRSSSQEYSIGDLYRLDFAANAVLDVNVDLDPFAREVGALQPWEEISQPSTKGTNP